MEAVGRLASGIAHDVSNMMTVVAGYSELLLDRLRPDETEQRETVEEIRRAGERAGLVTRQLLAFSRKQVFQPIVLNLNTVVAGMEKMLRSLIREDIELATVLDPTLNPVLVDPGQMEVVIMNLTVNARDAMPRGGKLTIETCNQIPGRHPGPDDFEVPSGACVSLAVHDTGCGMDEETKAHLFEPFFTTKEQGKGTGLRLAIVHGIVQRSGGCISISSEPEQGTTFKIYLPHVVEKVSAPRSCALTRQVTRGTETVLLVEDEAGVRHLACEVLRGSGYSVLEARHGKDALRICGQYAGPIHLLVTDMIMPEMNGRELGQRLGGLRPEMKVLYLSGYTEDMVVHQGLLDPDIAFLPKPFTPAALLRKTREVLDQAKFAGCAVATA